MVLSRGLPFFLSTSVTASIFFPVNRYRINPEYSTVQYSTVQYIRSRNCVPIHRREYGGEVRLFKNYQPVNSSSAFRLDTGKQPGQIVGWGMQKKVKVILLDYGMLYVVCGVNRCSRRRVVLWCKLSYEVGASEQPPPLPPNRDCLAHICTQGKEYSYFVTTSYTTQYLV